MKTYLSIDIDYWNDDVTSYLKGEDIEDTECYKWLSRVFTIARQRRIPVKAVMNHQQLTTYVNKSTARHLINIDTHSDLADGTVAEYSCGSWVSYVKWRHHGIYTWLHALDIEDGECNAETPIFEHGTRPSLTDWKEINRRSMGHPLKPEQMLKDVIEIGFVLSPAYCDPQLVQIFYQLVAEFQIPYTKGRYDEDDHVERRKPPGMTPARRKKIVRAKRRYSYDYNPEEE